MINATYSNDQRNMLRKSVKYDNCTENAIIYYVLILWRPHNGVALEKTSLKFTLGNVLHTPPYKCHINLNI